MKKQLFLGSLLPLTIGIIIYLIFRESDLAVYKWFALLKESNIILSIRNSNNLMFPSWFIYSAPDGLWIFSYCSLILLVWNNKVDQKNIGWLIILPVIGILSEFLQLNGTITGTFDVKDIISYLLGGFFQFYFSVIS